MLVIRAAQWAELEKYEQRRFLARVTRQLIVFHPPLAETPPSELEQALVKALARARSYGLELESHIAAFFRACALHGWEFDTKKDPAWNHLVHTLKSPSIPAMEKADVLDESAVFAQSAAVSL